MTTIETLLEAPAGFRSPLAARFMWQLDEQRRQLMEGTRGLTPAELEWQPAPGMNSIGMLMAHVAFAEAHMIQVGILGEAKGHAHDVIGITEEQEGLPLAAGAPPSPGLAGKDLGFFDDALARARAFAREAVAALADQDLDRLVRRPQADGTVRVFNVGWVLCHLIEHEAGHRGQIGLMRHLMRGR